MGTAALSVYRGDDRTYTLTFKDDDAVAIDITGCTVYFTVKEYDTDADSDAKITKTVTSHTDAANGITQVSLSDSDTDLTVKNYFYDIQLKDSAGLITTCAKDSFKVLQDVTTSTS